MPALPDAARRFVQFVAHRRRLAGRDAQLRKRAYDARRTQANMRAAEAAPHDEEVSNVTRIDRAVGNPETSNVVVCVPREEINTRLVTGVVQVYRPRAGRYGVLELPVVSDVVLREDPIAHDAARLALADEIRAEVQHLVRVRRPLLRERERAVDREQHPVADVLRLGDHVAVDAVFPAPFAVHGGDALRVRLGERRGERHGLVRVRARPHNGGAERIAVRRLRRAALSELVLRLAAHAPVRARPEADPAVARRVAEKRRREAYDAVRLQIERLDGGDRAVSVLLDAERARGEMEGDVRLVLDDAHAVPVAERDVCVAVHEPAAQLAHDRMLRLARAIDADFAGRIAAQHRAVLDERDLEAAPRRRHRRARPRHPAANDDEIGFHRLCHIRLVHLQRALGLFAGVREHDSCAASVEAGQIAERHRRLPADRYDAAVLPRPFARPRAEFLRERLAVDEHLEAPRSSVRPVLRPHPDAILSRSRKHDARLRVRHADAKPVRDEIRRAHDIHELHVKPPSARLEALRIDGHRGRIRRDAREDADD